MPYKVIAFVDGENLTLRYQDMIAKGAKPRNGTIYIPNALTWHPDITQMTLCEFVRITYYQTVVGDEPKLDELRDKIKTIEFQFKPQSTDKKNSWRGWLVPRIFKKEQKTSKSKSVDISLTVDMLRHAGQSHFDVLFLFSGDRDYLPLIEEIARSGKQVWLGAFSNGLNRRMKYAVDEFFDLDEIFFEKGT